MNMKWYKSFSILSAGILATLMFSCKNQDVEYPNFDYSTVYFPYQYPVRTIVLGEDIIDNSLDNAHKCKIYATMGGVYSNDNKVDIDISVDNALCNNLYFANNLAVQAMPSNYYTLASSQISLDGRIDGGVEVQLSDAFFADANSMSNTYVIPLQMTNVTNADSILSGKAKVDNPVLANSANWDIQPKNFVLYCVKFINQWHANYLRRGVDGVTENGVTTTVVRHKQYVENDDLIKVYTRSLQSVVFPVTTTIVVVEDGKNVTKPLTCDLVLTFANNECTITSGTAAYTATGTGKFVEKGEKNSWGNKDRSALYLDYQIDFVSKQLSTKDTLVLRDRGIQLETFAPVYKVN